MPPAFARGLLDVGIIGIRAVAPLKIDLIASALQTLGIVPLGLISAITQARNPSVQGGSTPDGKAPSNILAAAIAVLVVLHPLAAGPITYGYERGWVAHSSFMDRSVGTIYAPERWLVKQNAPVLKPLGELYLAYVHLWAEAAK